jgi:prolyl 4-hydroxylase
MDLIMHSRLLSNLPLFWTVDNLLSPAECLELLGRVEQLGPAMAPVTTSAGPKMMPGIRNNERVMFDDFSLAQLLFNKIEPHVPAYLADRKPSGCNERFRGYRYQNGAQFRPHFDGSFRRSSGEESELTLLVYLNEQFVGGETNFLDYETSIVPKTGMGLFFFHPILHEGCPVVSGTKYVLRTDVMYRGNTPRSS